MLIDIDKGLCYREIDEKHCIYLRKVCFIRKNHDSIMADIIAENSPTMKLKKPLKYSVVDTGKRQFLQWIREERISAIVAVKLAVLAR